MNMKHSLNQSLLLFSSLLAVMVCFGNEANKTTLTLQKKTDKPALLNIYKSPTCTCCGKWISHIEKNGFKTHAHLLQNLNSLKTQNGINRQYRSCHTAISTDNYVFEGHIPAKFIHRFLAKKPDNAIGLAVPAMPIGSPGMEVNKTFTPYKTHMIKKDGSNEVFANIQIVEDQY